MLKHEFFGCQRNKLYLYDRSYPNAITEFLLCDWCIRPSRLKEIMIIVMIVDNIMPSRKPQIMNMWFHRYFHYTAISCAYRIYYSNNKLILLSQKFTKTHPQ